MRHPFSGADTATRGRSVGLVLGCALAMGCSGHAVPGSSLGGGGTPNGVGTPGSGGSSTSTGMGGQSVVGGSGFTGAGHGGPPTSGAGGAVQVGAGGNTPASGGSADSGDADAGGECFSGPLVSVGAQPQRLLFLVDRSAAMGCARAGNSASAFASVRSALASLAGVITRPMSFGLEFFGGAEADAGSSCSSTDYQQPDLDVAPFPGDAAGIDGAFGARAPEGDAPLLPAVTGAIAHATSVAPTPAGAPAIVLVTGTGPTSCGSLEQVRAMVEAAASRGIQTFVIVVPTPTAGCDPATIATSTTGYEAIAKAGEIGPISSPPIGASVVQGTGADFESAFSTAVLQILGQWVTNTACLYKLPAMPAGFLDHEVTITYTDTSGAMYRLPESPKAFCATYCYDDPAAPTAVDIPSCRTVQIERVPLSVEVSCAPKAIGAGGAPGSGGTPNGSAGDAGVAVCPITAAFPVGDYYVDAVDESHRQQFEPSGSIIDRYQALAKSGILTIKANKTAPGELDVVFGEHEFDHVMRQDLSDGLHLSGTCSVGLSCPTLDNDRINVIVDRKTAVVYLEYLQNHPNSNDQEELTGTGWAKCAATTATSYPPGVPVIGVSPGPIIPTGLSLGCSETIATSKPCPGALPSGCTCTANDIAYDLICCPT